MENKDLIRVVMVQADKEELIVVEKFEHSLENLQEAVGGWIEAINIGDNIVMWINEEGKIHNLQPNFYLFNQKSNYDLVVGNTVITGLDNQGNTVGLTDSQLDQLKRKFINRRTFHLNA